MSAESTVEVHGIPADRQLPCGNFSGITSEPREDHRELLSINMKCIVEDNARVLVLILGIIGNLVVILVVVYSRFWTVD